MSKPRQQRSGFSKTPKSKTSRKKPAQSSAEHSAKEQQAVALINQGKLQEAEAIYRELIAACTGNHVVFGNLAAICLMQSRHDKSIPLLRKALQLKPNYPEAHNNLGNALKQQGDLTAAINSYNSALQLKPNYPEAHNNLGNALQRQGDLDAAIGSYKSALQLKPDYPEAHYNMGNTLQEQGDLTAAIASYNSALKLKPNHPDTHKNLSMTELLAGDYKSGWARYEHRFQCTQDKGILIANPSCSQWNGEVLAQGEKLLLISEQGLGDTLHFMRYATALRNEGISVSFCAPPKLHNLIQISGIDPSPLTPEQANQVADGRWIPLLSVPRRLEISPKNPIINDY